MPLIKVRDSSEPVKTHHKGSVITSHIRNAYTRTKEQSQRMTEDAESSPSEYASDNAQYMAENVIHDAGHLVQSVTEAAFRKGQAVYRKHQLHNEHGDAASASPSDRILNDDGITAIKDVEARFADIERSKELVFKIKKMFGFGARELTKLENELFTKWTRDYGYGEDVIKLAYDIMINAIQKVQPKYADKILEKWHVEGLRTAEEIEKYESEKRGAQKTAQSDPQKSYDLDDFFEAAMKRSFEELK